MLKPPEPAEEPQSERPVGELVHQLVEQGKAYALAELAVAKAIGTARPVRSRCPPACSSRPCWLPRRQS
jgi:hypothetical protein